jgi:hypothetical protein
VFELLETAKREFKRDRETAKASLSTASCILCSEIERRSRAKGARADALAAWQIVVREEPQFQAGLIAGSAKRALRICHNKILSQRMRRRKL